MGNTILIAALVLGGGYLAYNVWANQQLEIARLKAAQAKASSSKGGGVSWWEAAIGGAITGVGGVLGGQAGAKAGEALADKIGLW